MTDVKASDIANVATPENEIEITPEMIEAGREVIADRETAGDDSWLLPAIFRAMWAARRHGKTASPSL